MGFHGLLTREKSVLVIIDVQEKLFPLIHDKERVLENLRKLIQFAKIVVMPIILTEQYPKGLGRTIPEIKEILQDAQQIEKVEFSCFGSEKFRDVLKNLGVKNLIIAGIETHICIAQTSIEGIDNGYRVYVVSDASSSRSIEDKNISLERMKQNNIMVASIEMLIYEILRKAGTREFNETLKLIKA